MPDSNPNNCIDRLWRNRHDQAAEKELRELWLAFQADRKEAWQQLEALVETSQVLEVKARNQIGSTTSGLDGTMKDNLVFDAIQAAKQLLRESRWTIPATNDGVFVPYLKTQSNSGRYIWVDRAIREYFSRRPRTTQEDRLRAPDGNPEAGEL